MAHLMLDRTSWTLHARGTSGYPGEGEEETPHQSGTPSGPRAAGPETAAPEAAVEMETIADLSLFFRSPLSPFPRALDLGLGIHHDVGMPAPQVSPHSYGCEEIANED
jgi:hypothetical protein